MVNRILIAEDIDSINTGIITILNEKFNMQIEHANSCDNAYLKILKAQKDQIPFDLLISDLSFKSENYLENKLKNGEELIKASKQVQNDLKTIVYTIEDKTSLLKRLKDELQVNSIVLKGLNSLMELCKAIDKVKESENYFPQEVVQKLKNDSTTTITPFDTKVLELLSQGFTQQDIAKKFKEQSIKPNSLSALEKRISELKSIFSAKNSIHLVAIAKDMCII